MKKTLGFILILTLLTGCQKERSHEYLLQHPEKLNNELAQCRENKEYTSYCDMVKQTAEQFSALSSLRAENPEAFGKQILTTEIEVAKLHKAATDEKNTEKAREDAMKAYQQEEEKLKTLLAVVAGMGMPGA